MSIASGRDSQNKSGRNTRYEDSEADYAAQDEQVAVDLEAALDGQALRVSVEEEAKHLSHRVVSSRAQEKLTKPTKP